MMSDWKRPSELRMKNRLPFQPAGGLAWSGVSAAFEAEAAACRGAAVPESACAFAGGTRPSGASRARDLALIRPFLQCHQRTLLLLDELAQLLHLGFQFLDLGRADRLARVPFCLRVSRSVP